MAGVSYLDYIALYKNYNYGELLKKMGRLREARKHFEKAIEISLELGITNFQFGDGFGPAISKVDIVEILKFIGNQNSIKVVGSIKTLTQVVDLFDSGIDCIGTSNFNEIFKEIRLI